MPVRLQFPGRNLVSRTSMQGRIQAVASHRQGRHPTADYAR